ncbi:unnamed protein product [Pleuronectes platessa]|uniref:Uncharacterized protein n=1 Tax=Pleuronectes platessa TaxID=8262 RepID=A0A9N7VNS8_PLEPL|nr:unnamed protein product [Pleuronectes platessa]
MGVCILMQGRVWNSLVRWLGGEGGWTRKRRTRKEGRGGEEKDTNERHRWISVGKRITLYRPLTHHVSGELAGLRWREEATDPVHDSLHYRAPCSITDERQLYAEADIPPDRQTGGEAERQTAREEDCLCPSVRRAGIDTEALLQPTN